MKSGTASVSGDNYVRLNTGSSLTFGTYTLISAASGLTGSFQFDGRSSLSVSALSQIKNVGGINYRLTLQNSGTAQQVVVAAAPSNVINIMPLGSSITEGASSEPGTTYAGGGYRSELYQSLVNDGRFTPHFVGSQTVLDAHSTPTYNVLSGANELNHEGHSGYTTTQILKNLNANGGDGGNNGGSWLATGNGKNPDYVTLSIGGNDYGANGSETTAPLKRTDAIVSQIASLRPDAQVIVSNLFYRTQTSGGNVVGDLQNTYYNPGVQGTVFNHVLAGQHVSFYDAYSAVTPGGNISHIFDGIHPDTAGYNSFADGWYNALANGSAFWTGASGGQWSASTNFAQNYQLTTPRQGALGASTDVLFNSNASPLNTTLGGNLSVRSVNFAAGATGTVTIGGPNMLTLGAGGITVQAGTGAHTISSNVFLGTDQMWGNVSSNPLAVTGNISGSGNLTIVGSAVVDIPGTLSGNTYTTTTQTISGTGAFVLSGENAYTGTTSINNGTLIVNGDQHLATGAVSVGSAAKLYGTGIIGGATTVLGTLSGGNAAGAIGTLNLSNTLNFSTGSIFDWDIANTGATYDKALASGLVSGAGAIFNVVLNGGGGFADPFWDTSRNWTATELFGATNVNVNLVTIFSGSNPSFATNPLEGSFSFTSTGGGTNNQLTWSAVPEPTNALTALLLACGLLRRNRRKSAGSRSRLTVRLQR